MAQHLVTEVKGIIDYCITHLSRNIYHQSKVNNLKDNRSSIER